MESRPVLAHSKPLADSVLSGIKPRDVAYQESIDAEKRACENPFLRHVNASATNGI